MHKRLVPSVRYDEFINFRPALGYGGVFLPNTACLHPSERAIKVELDLAT